MQHDCNPPVLHLADHGFRAIAHDRRGHGRSTQVWDGNDMDHYADDLAAVIDGLDVSQGMQDAFWRKGPAGRSQEHL